ncbi:MAG: type II toxin-antitoxin system death-on-curing family toxin [Alphaproteobacteria bacterium]
MIKVEDIILLHSIVSNKYEIINNNIQSCLSSIDYYESIEDKISSIIRAIIKNHYFLDGNKRTALATYFILCDLYELKIIYNDDELGYVFEDIAKNNYSVKEISKILFNKNSKKEM